MADDSQDKSSKTEEPTPKKLEDARKKGQVVQSREIGHFFIILAFTGIVVMFAPSMARDFIAFMHHFLSQPDQIPMTSGAVTSLIRDMLGHLFSLIALPIVLLIAAALAPAVIQNKFFFALERIKPKLEKISPIKGFGRMFGLKAFVEFLKSVIKISLVAAIAFFVISPSYDQLVLTNNINIVDSLSLLSHHLLRLLLAVSFFLLLISFLDYTYQRFEFLKNLRMSRQEIKDEHKQQEGDPHMKAKRRQIARERAQNQMMANVPKADVVITNPTHYAVALKYEQGEMHAPTVVAKGVDKVAARIRESAEEHKVPIMRNPPLARALYDTTDIDEEVPVKHYEAVAKIISHVYKLKGKQLTPPANTRNKPTRK